MLDAEPVREWVVCDAASASCEKRDVGITGRMVDVSDGSRAVLGRMLGGVDAVLSWRVDGSGVLVAASMSAWSSSWDSRREYTSPGGSWPVGVVCGALVMVTFVGVCGKTGMRDAASS